MTDESLRSEVIRIAADLPKGDGTRRKLLAALSEEQQWDLMKAIDKTKMPDGYVVHLEYPGVIFIGSKDDPLVELGATPEWEGENIIALQIGYDGNVDDGWDIKVRWTGDAKKDAKLYEKAMKASWDRIMEAVERVRRKNAPGLSDQQVSELIKAIDGTKLATGWQATSEYPGFIAIHKKDAPFSILATPDWEGSNIIAVGIEFEDGDQDHLDVLDVMWSGDVKKDKALWMQAMKQAWPGLKRKVEREYGYFDEM